MSNTNKSTESTKRGSNITPKTRKSYFNSDAFQKRTKDAIEHYRGYLNGRPVSRAQKEALKYFAAPFDRGDDKFKK